MAPKRALLLAASLTLAFPPVLRAASREITDQWAGPPPGGVVGRVMTGEGRPVRGVRVTLQRRGENPVTVETDETGDYCFCRVSAARDYTLTLEKNGYATVIERDFFVGKRKISVLNKVLRPLSEFSPGREQGER